MIAAALVVLLCGSERWAVKTASDAASATISLAPRHTTVAAMSAMPRHQVGPKTARITGLETTLWDVDAIVCLNKAEADGDRHVVIADTVQGCTSGPTMIVEAPSAACAAASRFRTRLRTARAVVETWKAGAHVRLQGPGFQDFDHQQTGRARSGIEIHPVLWVR